ncbi:MAG TPA: DUF374 domain-containing protein [Paracoccaceae bacterium]|nr:DUF374 domain-containing protein [Paracoccaceae bacterium]
MTEQTDKRPNWEEGRPLGRIAAIAVAVVIYSLLRLWSATWRIDKTEMRRLEDARATGRPVIGIVWHGTYAPLFQLVSGQPALVVTSYSFRGSVIARFCGWFGFHAMQVERGNHGGRRAIREALAKPNALVAIAPDGPLGPRHEAKPGAAALAVEFGALLVPISATSSRKKIVTSRWDKMELPLPTARVKLRVGEAFEVPKDASPEEAKALVENALNALI